MPKRLPSAATKRLGSRRLETVSFSAMATIDHSRAVSVAGTATSWSAGVGRANRGAISDHAGIGRLAMNFLLLTGAGLPSARQPSRLGGSIECETGATG